MRKNKDFKTYGRHRNRVISTDVWMSDNDKRKNVFSSSSELDLSKQSSIFQLSSSSSERSGETSASSVFESNKKTGPNNRQTNNKENVPVSRKKNTVSKQKEQEKIFSLGSSTDSSYEVDKKTSRRALRDRNKKIDYNDSANMKKQLRGTTAKRKRAVKVKDDDKAAGESTNFSEFDEYSLVISDSPVVKNSKSLRQELIETSTPVAKRTRGQGQENIFDKIRTSDLSHIEMVSVPSPGSNCSVYTPAISLPNSISMISGFSTPPVTPNIVLDDILSECSPQNYSSPVAQTPDNVVVQLDKLRQSFILKHVTGRKKSIKPSRANQQSKIPEEIQSRTPEDVACVMLQRLTSSFIETHSSARKNCSVRLTEEPNNSQSLFDSPYVPYILTRNKAANEQNHTDSEQRQDENSSLDSEKTKDLDDSDNELINGDDSDDDDSDGDEEEVEEDENDDISIEVGNLSAINEDEEDYSDADGEDDKSEIEEDEIDKLQNSMKDLYVSDKSNRPSEETLYMLNPDYVGEDCENGDNAELGESEEGDQISGSRDLFSNYGGNSKISLRSSKSACCKSDYFSATSANVSEEEEFETANDEEDSDDEENDDDVENNDDEDEDEEVSDSEDKEAEREDISMEEDELNSKRAEMRKSYSLRDKHLLSLQDSFKELLTPTKKKNSLVPLSARTKLLVLCNQSEPVPFTEAIPKKMLSQCKKIGEGVYGEVFRTCGVALKIIPIEGDFSVNDEPQKKFEEILPEVVIAKELSSLRNCKSNMTSNFCEVKSVSLVKGSYPAKLLKEWDLFHKNKGSENDRPDMFTDNQLFIVFEFADCGKALESFEFENMHQANSVLTQVVYSLAVAEESLQFEHRDLHWGNVLVKSTDKEDITYKVMGKRCSVPSMGVEANIIDFTLSRLTKDKCSVYTDLSQDDALFEGKGDYQFDIYRKMKEENGNNWESFNPHSNVLWLHYLADKLVYSKKYPTQTSREDRDIIRQFRQFLGTMLDYQSALEMAGEALFLNS